MSQNAVTPDEAANRACCQLSGEKFLLSCMGPRCMAWRWADDLNGFCGMAGRPDTPADELLEKWPELARIIRESLK